MKKKKFSHGFTIMEIMIAIIVLGAMAAFALPRITGTIELFRSKEGVQALHTVWQAQLSADVDVAEGRIASYLLADLDITIPAYNNFGAPVLDFDGSGGIPTVTINAVAYPIYAHIDRNGGAYTFYVQPDGTILCDTQNPCERLYYAPW